MIASPWKHTETDMTTIYKALASMGQLRMMLTLAAVVPFAACDDDPTDPSDPGPEPAAEVQASATSFPDTELAVGTDDVIVIDVRNAGGANLEIERIELIGGGADQFEIRSGDGTATVAPGDSRDVVVGFSPTSEGDMAATVAIVTNDPVQSRVEVPVRGQAARFQYRQVDRMGIPGLNTVFNHPSGVGPFDKTAYNLALPVDDVQSYTDLFIAVLDAVGNPDSPGTAALLLPDELPVSLAADPTSFATLTGRALADDAVDVALAVTVGIDELMSDNVDANDAPFRSTFPYVAAPH
jgi:hypothetical protein